MHAHKQHKKADFISILAFIILSALAGTLIFQSQASAYTRVGSESIQHTPESLAQRRLLLSERRRQQQGQIDKMKARRLFTLSAGPLWYSIATLSPRR